MLTQAEDIGEATEIPDWLAPECLANRYRSHHNVTPTLPNVRSTNRHQMSMAVGVVITLDTVLIH